MMSAALFGRRSKKGVDDPPVTSGVQVAPSGPNVFAPDADHANYADRGDHGGPAPDPVDDRASNSEMDEAVTAETTLADPAAGMGGNVHDGDQAHDGLIGGSLLAELEARIHSNDPAPHPVRPQEMWHPGVTPLPVDLPPPPTEQRIDQAELEGTDSAPGRFRFNRLRRVTPGEAPGASVEAPAAYVAREEPIGDVLFGELFTSDRIPSGTERLGSDAAPLVPGSGGASGALINGPVGRNARGSGRVLNRIAEVTRDKHVDEPGDWYEDDDRDELPAPAGVAPLGDPTQDPVDDQVPDAVNDHHADPVVEPTVAAEQASEQPPLQPQPVAVDSDGLADVGDTSLRFDRDADTTVVDHGSTVSVSLTDGWCWAALGDEARPVEVATEGTTLQCPAATTVLVAVDDTGRFMVVVRGEAALSAGGRRIRLRAGAMAFLPHGSDDAQVDVASEIEVAADPLVALNLDLDAKR